MTVNVHQGFSVIPPKAIAPENEQASKLVGRTVIVSQAKNAIVLKVHVFPKMSHLVQKIVTVKRQAIATHAANAVKCVQPKHAASRATVPKAKRARIVVALQDVAKTPTAPKGDVATQLSNVAFLVVETMPIVQGC